MKKFFVALVAFFAIANAKPYDIDYTHTSVDFDVKHLTLTNVMGYFDDFTGKIEIDDDGKITALEADINANSLHTRNAKRDRHMKSQDFLYVSKFKKITFKATRFDGDNVYGDLTIRGVTRPVKLEADVEKGTTPKGKTFYSVKLEGDINRKDFNVGTSFANAIVSDKVDLKITIEAY